MSFNSNKLIFKCTCILEKKKNSQISNYFLGIIIIFMQKMVSKTIIVEYID